MKFERQSGNLQARAFAAALVLAAGRLVTRGLALASVVVTARLLEPADYGVAAIAFTIVGLLHAVFEPGSGVLLVVKDDLNRHDLDTAFTIGAGRGCLFAAVLFFGAQPLAVVLGDARLRDVLEVLALSPLLTGFMNPAMAVYSRDLDFRREVVRDVGGALIAGVLGILAAVWLRNYWALVIATVGTVLVQTLLTWWRIPYRPRLGLREWRRFTAFGGWVAGERLLAQLGLVAPQAVVWHVLSPAALGVFTVARNLQALPLTEMLEPIRRSLLPGFAALAGDRDALRRAVRKTQGVIAALAVPVGVGMAALAPEIVRVMLGRQWLAAVPLLQILGPALALKTAAAPALNVAMALGALRAALARTALLTAATWPALAAGVVFFGLAGAAWAMAAMAALRIVLNGLLLRRLLGEPVLGLFVAGWRSVVAAGVMAGGLWLVPVPFDAGRPVGQAALLLGGQIGLGAVLYGVAHAALWHLAGRPGDGAEVMAMRFAGSLAQRVRAMAGRPGP